MSLENFGVATGKPRHMLQSKIQTKFRVTFNDGEGTDYIALTQQCEKLQRPAFARNTFNIDDIIGMEFRDDVANEATFYVHKLMGRDDISITIETLHDDKVLESWEMHSCRVHSVHYSDLDYKVPHPCMIFVSFEHGPVQHKINTTLGSSEVVPVPHDYNI